MRIRIVELWGISFSAQKSQGNVDYKQQQVLQAYISIVLFSKPWHQVVQRALYACMHAMQA
jgi:hypothetical protein